MSLSLGTAGGGGVAQAAGLGTGGLAGAFGGTTSRACPWLALALAAGAGCAASGGASAAGGKAAGVAAWR